MEGQNGGTAAHRVCVSDGDMELMVRRGSTANHNPVSNLKPASGAARAPWLVSVGSTWPWAPTGGLQQQPRPFEEIAGRPPSTKGVGSTPLRVTARQALEMATVNGARAPGGGTPGPLPPGKTADLDPGGPWTPSICSSCHDVEEDLVYSARVPTW